MALVEHPHSKDQRKAPEGQGCPAAPSCVAVGSHHCARHSEWGLARGERHSLRLAALGSADGLNLRMLMGPVPDEVTTFTSRVRQWPWRV